MTRTEELQKRLAHLRAAAASMRASVTCAVLDRRDRTESERIEGAIYEQAAEVEEMLERRGVGVDALVSTIRSTRAA